MPASPALRQLESERLTLRRWIDSDRPAFAELNADAEVMRYFPAPLSPDASDAFVDRVEAHFDEHGFGLWAVETKTDHAFIGFVGLWPASFSAHFTPAVEVGWRLARHAWGVGFAPEAASVALADGFGRLGLAEIVSFTAAINTPSRRVMEKVGMSRDPSDDFDHPKVAEGDPLQRHVLYRLHR